MQTFGSFLVAVLSASMTAGSVLPNHVAPITKAGATLKIAQVHNANFVGRNGPAALAKAYAKYGASIPQELHQAAIDTGVRLASINSKRDEGSATATPDNGDLEYLVPVQIGSPAQTLNLDFDTGSSDLWVFSSETPQSEQSGHDVYNPSKSSTSSEARGQAWDITYGDGSSSSGNVYYDHVTIGNLTVDKQAVESAKKVSDQFVQGQNDGLVGLAFSSINTVSPTRQSTWFDNIKSRLDAPLFTADLRHNQAGSYLFGGIPSKASNINYASVDNSQGFWAFDTAVSGAGSFSAIADTGTTLILTNDDLVKSYYSNVRSAKNDNQQGGVVVDCDEDLPDFEFQVGKGTITVPGSYVNYGSLGNGHCYGGIQSAGNIPFSIWGDVALKAAYVVFDDGNKRVGWAQKV